MTTTARMSARAAPFDADAARVRELRDFLRSRRAALSPEDCGLPARGRRRTPGLRREEVANIADVGVSWYTWLEQGREIKVSGEVLERIAGALRLNAAEERYLFSLAGVAHALPSDPPVDLSPVGDIQAVVDSLELPALVFGPIGDVVAFNDAADALFDFGGCEGPFACNLAWRLFKDPKRKAIYVNWEASALRTVGQLRMRLARYAGNERIACLLAELRSDADFVRMWERAAVLPEETIDLILRRPPLGELRFRSIHLVVVNAADHVMATLVPADPRSKRATKRLCMPRRRRRSIRPAYRLLPLGTDRPAPRRP